MQVCAEEYPREKSKTIVLLKKRGTYVLISKRLR